LKKAERLILVNKVNAVADRAAILQLYRGNKQGPEHPAFQEPSFGLHNIPINNSSSLLNPGETHSLLFAFHQPLLVTSRDSEGTNGNVPCSRDNDGVAFGGFKIAVFAPSNEEASLLR
jgi:hypothetical protein